MEVILNRDRFEARPASAALQDERHQYFVLANLKELSCLDIRRVIAAAKRLSAVNPDKMRGEVSSRLVELLREPWGRDAEYVTALASALVVWAEPDHEEAQRVVDYVATELKKADCEIPGVSDQVFTAWFGKEKFGVASGGMEKGSPEVGGRMQGSRPNGRS